MALSSSELDRLRENIAADDLDFDKNDERCFNAELLLLLPAPPAPVPVPKALERALLELFPALFRVPYLLIRYWVTEPRRIKED